MRLSSAINRINYRLRGIDDDAPAANTDEWNYWVDTLNSKKDDLYDDTNQTWDNTYEDRELTTVSASAAPEFDLDDDFIAPSSDIYIVTTDGQYNYFEIVKAKEIDRTKQQAYIVGQNPKVLKFTQAFEADSNLIGGTLHVSGYYMPADLTSNSQTLPFTDPNWAIMATAAEIAFNDIVYETKAPDLNAKANDLWKKMIAKNRRGTYKNPRKVATSVHRISSPSRRR